MADGNEQGAGQPQGGQQPSQPQQERTFTQAEVNALIGQTRQDVRGQFADYDALKEKAGKFDASESEKLSELEKANQAKADADKRASEALGKANDRLLRAAFIAEASKLGVKNPADAYALALADGAQTSIDEAGNAVGVEAAVKTLVEGGRLVLAVRSGSPGLDGGAGGQQRPAKTITLTDEQKRMAQYAGMTEEQYIQYLTMQPVRETPDAGTEQ